jgi:tetratricopeptide (TPR) repeat protein
MAATPAAMKPQAWQVAGICVVLVLMVLAVFGQTARFGFLNSDDNLYVVENAHVTGGLSLKGLAWVFTHADCFLYHPLTMLSLMADYQLYGLHAGGYHLTNVLLHAASALLLFLVLRQMTGALWRSAFVAALFAIHPLRVESVAWVAERKDVLSGFFFMLTLQAYVQYVHKPNSPARYLMVAAAFLLALLSKPTVVTLPFVLLLLDYWPLNRFERPGKLSRLLLEKIPLLALAAGACAMTGLAAEKWITPNALVSMPLRLGNALVYYAVYLRQMIWPEGLAVPYPDPHHGLPPWEVALAGALLAGLSAVAWKERRTRPWLLIGWLWYLGMLTPMIGIVPAGATAQADRYTYLPQIGIYVALTWFVAEWRVRRVALAGLMAGVLLALMVCAWKQTAYWKNSETLWTRALACTTSNSIAHLNFGNVLFQKGKVDEAILHYQEALQIKPDYTEARYDLGNALLQKGRVDAAIAQYQKALQITPDYAESHNSLGLALDQKGRVDEAIAHYQKALEINADNAEAHNNLGNALLRKGRVDQAIAHYQKALEINADNAEAHNNLGNALLQKGRVEQAINQYRKALQIKPGFAQAHYNIGNILLQQGRVEAAITHYQKALQFRPDYAEAHLTLGSALLQQGRAKEAITQFQMAVKIKPDYAEAHYDLGNSFSQLGRTDEAISQYQRALQLRPDYAAALVNLGNSFFQQGRMDQAISQYQKALQIGPVDPEVQNNLAWCLATCPEASLRNGDKAVQLARQANELAGGKNPVILGTLAAAFAETGQFGDAVRSAQKAIDLARSAGRQDLAGKLNGELRRYEAGLPLHQ